jgi:hypothetical protein
VSSFAFAIFCLAGFTLPAFLIAWLDRPRTPRAPKG